MAHLHLPAQHSDDDLAIAGALAQVLRSDDLYVAWSSEGGPGEPVIPAELHVSGWTERPQARPGLLARLLNGFRRTS